MIREVDSAPDYGIWRVLIKNRRPKETRSILELLIGIKNGVIAFEAAVPNQSQQKAGRPCQLMAENDHSWFQEDTSWRKTTAHGLWRIPLR